MKKQGKPQWHRLLSFAAALVLVVTVVALPALAMGMSRSEDGVGGRHRGFMNRAADSVESGVESIADGITDIPNAIDDSIVLPNETESDEDVTDTAPVTEDGGLIGDESLEDGTNIPDTDIGGAIKDDDGDGISNPTDSDDDNDGLSDAADSDADGNGRADADESTGIIGIVIAVIVVIAIIVLVIAVMPRAKKK